MDLGIISWNLVNKDHLRVKHSKTKREDSTEIFTYLKADFTGLVMFNCVEHIVRVLAGI